MNVLITGGTGTLGGYIFRELLGAGHAVTDFSNTRPSLSMPGVEYLEGDINSVEQLARACAGKDAVIHLAAIPGPNRLPPEQTIHVNLTCTVHVLEAAKKAGVGKVVFASSGAATGFSFQRRELIPRYLPLDEEHPCAPQDEYGLSKLLGELACKQYSDGFGMRTICLRLNHNWYTDRAGAEFSCGSGWARNLSVDELWAKRYRKILDEPDGVWPTPGPPAPHKILWAVTDARDAAQIFRLAVENETLNHEVFLVAGDDTCSREETPRLIEKYYPGVPLRASLKDFASCWSHEKATRLLGYKPKYTWRKSEFLDWLESRRD